MKETVIPPQREGSSLDTDYQITCESVHEALGQFRISSVRLLDVNNWHLLCGPLSSRFEIVSMTGVLVERHAIEGDYFRISIPAPGPVGGDGFDWVRIEQIEEKGDASTAEQRISMRVRPASNPAGDQSDVAHFFGPEATSTFRVTRTGSIVSASVHGRNETANADTSKATDKIRNALVSLGARAGVSSIQWNSLVKGIIEGPAK
jgi:hypothetical protein